MADAILKLIVSAERASLDALRSWWPADLPRSLLVAAEPLSTAPALYDLLRKTDTIVALDLFGSILTLVRTLQQHALTLDLLYLRPRLFRYPEGLDALTYPHERSEDLRKLLIACDCHLSRGQVIDMEDLHFHAPEALAAIAGWAGQNPPAVQPANTFGPSTYGSAMSGVAQALHGVVVDTSDLLLMGTDHFVREGDPTVLILREGWYSPEPNFVWSIAPVSWLHLPLPRGRTHLRCKLTGFRVQPDIALSLWIGGKPAEALFFPRQATGSLEILLRLEAGEAAYVDIELRYGRTLIPNTINPASGDFRELAFGLAAIRLDEAPGNSAAAEGWTVADLYANDPDGTALITLRGGLGNAESIVAGSGRIVASDVQSRGSTANLTTDPPSLTTFQNELEDFVRSLDSEGRRTHLTVGPKRVRAFMQATRDIDGVRRWMSAALLIDMVDIDQAMLAWVAAIRFTLIVETDKVLVYPEGL